MRAARHPGRRAALVLSLAGALAVTAATAPAALAGDWTVAEITGPPGIRWIQPNAVNIHGVVVGQARFPGRAESTAFRWEDGQMIELDLGGQDRSTAFDVNDAGVIVGRVGFDNGAVWSATRTSSTVSPTAFNISGRFGSSAYAINEAGTIAGSAGDTGNMPAPFERSTYDNRFPALTTGGGWSRLFIPPTVRRTDTGTVASIVGGDAMQINDHGRVLLGGVNMSGRPRIWNGGDGDSLDMVAGNQGFNDHDQIAGRSLFSNPNRDPFSARVWHGGQYVDVGAGQERSRANAINNHGWVVGRAGTEDWQAEYRQVGNAWLWRLDGAPASLAELGPTGWSYANALDVNDDGVIVGVGQHGGREVGFMMTPSSIAHRLTGTIWGVDGQPIPGAAVRIVGAAGQDLTPGLRSGADGRYEATLSRGTYEVTVLPHGAYVPNAGAGCTIVAVFTCALGIRQNRVVDFFGVPHVPPVPPPPIPERRDDGRTSARRPAAGPAIRGPRPNATLTVAGGGTVGIGLGPFAEAVSGTVTLQQPAAGGRGRGRASGRASARRRGARRPAARAVLLGRSSFRASARRAVVVRITLNRAARRLLRQRGRVSVVALVDVRGTSTSTSTASFRLTLRAAGRARGRARRAPRGRR